MAVIVLSTSDNPHATAVGAELIRRGVEVIRVDADSMPLVSLAVPVAPELLLERTIPRKRVQAVFVHHPRMRFSHDSGFDSVDRALAGAAWRNWLAWLEYDLRHVPWVNGLTPARSSSEVGRQLGLAAAVGFQVPRTCLTNSIDVLKRFGAERKPIIMKSGPIPNVLPDDHRLLAHIIDVDAVDPNELRASPCLFQEYIPKQFELRVHVIGESVLACRIESQASEPASIDWRNYDIAHTPHFPIELPPAVVDRCRTLVRGLNLRFGVLDLIVTPDDDVVFLECNAQGSWEWIQRLTALRITETLVDNLLRARVAESGPGDRRTGHVGDSA